MKQFKLTFVLIILISMVGLQAFAASGKVRVGGLYYYLEGNQAQLAQGLFGYDGAIVIPSEITYNGYKYSVTSIGEYAFYECYDLTSVTIPNSVTWIAYNAFWMCPNLTSVTLNSNAIVSQSYTESYSIKRYLGEQVNSYIIGDDVRSIGEYAFSGCSALTSITIGNSVTSIGEYAFSGCSALTSITIGNSVTSIGQDAFKNTALTKVIVNDIAAWCKISFRNGYSNPLYFANHLYSDENTEVTDLVIPNSVTSVNFAAFLGCSMLTSVIIPNSVTSIGKSAFSHCI